MNRSGAVIAPRQLISREGEAPDEPCWVSSVPPTGSAGASPSRRCAPQSFEDEYDEEDDNQRRPIHAEIQTETCVPFTT